MIVVKRIKGGKLTVERLSVPLALELLVTWIGISSGIDVSHVNYVELTFDHPEADQPDKLRFENASDGNHLLLLSNVAGWRRDSYQLQKVRSVFRELAKI